MAWVKVTSHGDKREFWVNTDKLALIERREGWLYTALYEPGEDGEVYKVEETPDEIIDYIGHWEADMDAAREGLIE